MRGEERRKEARKEEEKRRRIGEETRREETRREETQKHSPHAVLSIFLLRVTLSEPASAQQHTQKTYDTTPKITEPPTRKWIKRCGGSVFIVFLTKTLPPRRFITFPAMRYSQQASKRATTYAEHLQHRP